MKIAPLIRAAEAHNANRQDDAVQVEWRLVHTGQHYDEKMSEVFFRELGIPAPDFNLGVGSGSHAAQTAQVMLKFEPALLAEKPDWVVVVGDVNSTVACALVAAKLGFKIAHVEAGLRSFDRTMPEEINRLVTDAISDLLLTPSTDGNENLRREGVPDQKIKLVGNIMIDSLAANLPQARASTILRSLHLEPGRYVYVTLHRPSNVDDRESSRLIVTELRALAGELPVAFPIHPRTRNRLTEFGIAVARSSEFAESSPRPVLLLLDPLGYNDSLCLTEHARFVLTDSGGLQEESNWFQTPCLTLRPNTERPVTVTVGSNPLTTLGQLGRDIEDVLGRNVRLGMVPSLWDGRAADRILQELLNASEPTIHSVREVARL